MADSERKFKSMEEALEFKKIYEAKYEETLARFDEQSKGWQESLEKYFDVFTAYRIIKQAKESILREKSLFEGLFNESFIEMYPIENFESAYHDRDGSKEVSKIEKLIGVLQAADELPLETVQQFYLELANTPGNRLFSFEILKHSNHADIFAPLILKDYEQEYGVENPNHRRAKADLEERAHIAAEMKANANANQNGDE